MDENKGPDKVEVERGLRDGFEDPSMDLRIDEMDLPKSAEWDEAGAQSPLDELPDSLPDSPADVPLPELGPIDTQPAEDSREFRSPRASKASKTFRSMGNKVPTEPQRARAEEVNSGAKPVPKVEEEIGDFFGLEIELAAWFADSGKNVALWVDELEADHSKEPRAELYRLLLHRDAATVSAAISELTSRVLSSGPTHKWVEEGLSDSDDFDATFDEHTLLFVRLCAWHASGSPPLDIGVDLLARLLVKVANMRWFAEFGADDNDQTASYVSRLFMLARMALLATFGNAHHLREAEVASWKQCGLDLPATDEEYASPVNYAAFVDEITSRYPAYMPGSHEHEDGYRRGIRLARGARPSEPVDGPYDPADPRDLVGGQRVVMPYVPHSIVEAAELFKAHVRTTPAIEQLLSEQILATAEPKQGAPAADSLEDGSPALRAVKELYRKTARVQKSVSSVAVDFLMHVGKEGPGPRVHAALATLRMLLQWFRAAHVLMFEHLAALLFDCQFHLLAHLFCSKHPQVAALVQEPYVADVIGGAASWGDLPAGLWALVTGPAAGPAAVYDGPPLIWPMNDAVELVIPHVNKFNLQTFTHLLGISRLMVTGKTQRLLVVAELTVDAFKPLLSVYEADMWQQLLQYLKAQVPFTGKRWRYLNMELISAIYLYCPSSIDDNWLSGNDVTQTVRSAGAEEAALRGLVEQYTARIL